MTALRKIMRRMARGPFSEPAIPASGGGQAVHNSKIGYRVLLASGRQHRSYEVPARNYAVKVILAETRGRWLVVNYAQAYQNSGRPWTKRLSLPAPLVT